MFILWSLFTSPLLLQDKEDVPTNPFLNDTSLSPTRNRKNSEKADRMPAGVMLWLLAVCSPFTRRVESRRYDQKPEASALVSSRITSSERTSIRMIEFGYAFPKNRMVLPLFTSALSAWKVGGIAMFETVVFFPSSRVAKKLEASDRLLSLSTAYTEKV